MPPVRSAALHDSYGPSYRDTVNVRDMADSRSYEPSGSRYDRPPPSSRGFSPSRMGMSGSRGASPPRMDPGRGISPPRMDYGAMGVLSPPRIMNR